MAAHKGLYVHGEWITGYGKEKTSLNPYNGQTVWKAPVASKSDVARAVRAAKTAFYNWSQTPFDERAKCLNAYKKSLREDSGLIAEAISQETGKPLWESKTEVQAMMGKIDISIQAYQDRCPLTSKEQKGYTSFTRHRPHGVAAVLGPFNFPGHLPNGHIVPALLAGNTIVFKPSEETPLVAELMVKCLEKAGVPPGVVNLLQGGADIGKTLSEHQEIDALFFTGSYQTGQKLLNHFSKHPEKILALEMGGNNPLVVSHVEDTKAAAYTALQSAFLTSGQRCTCARRLIVVCDKQGEKFIEELVGMIKKIKVGHYKETPEPFMGPVISQSAAVKAVMKQGSLELHGGQVMIKLKHLEENTGRLTPGLIDVTEVKDLPDEETFAPLLQLIRAPHFNEAVAIANNTRYGLSAGLLSDSQEEWDQFFTRTKAGVVNWNRPTTGASSAAPFGGVGLSGNHRPSAYYAADYCAYPVASVESKSPTIPESPLPGIDLEEKPNDSV